MPLPLFIGIAAGLAAAGGVGAGVRGAVKMKEANDTMKSADERHKRNMKRFETKNRLTTECMDMLGKKEMEILSSFEKFANLYEKIQNKPEFADITLNGNVLPKYDGEDLKKVSIGACALMSGIAGAAFGTAGGFAAAGATTAAVMALGSASTGAAITSLSGVAATNATLALLGGGTLAAGGGGIALGTTMLGVATAGVGLLIGGIIFNVTGSSISNKADEAYDQMKKAEKEINAICAYLDELKFTASKYRDTLNKVDKIYKEHLDALENLVNKDGKIDWLLYTKDEQLLVENTVMLVGVLYKMCKVKLVLVSEQKNSINKVNKTDIEEASNTANATLRLFNVETIENISQDLLSDENCCVATIATMVYFANCDGNISSEERELLEDTVTYITENTALSEKANNDIESIMTNNAFTFFRLRTFLDRVPIDKLELLKSVVDETINANGKVSTAEKEAKKAFIDYIKYTKDKTHGVINILGTAKNSMLFMGSSKENQKN